jgi:MFS family permease
MFAGVLTMLLAMGWAANHFAALLPAISLHHHLSTATLDVMFGIYAVGLLPGLLLGGRASDRLGRASVALVGSTTALVGTIAMLVSQHADVLLAGRLIVGIGVGLAVSS